MEKYLGEIVEVTIDRKIGSCHPEHGFIYPINYGFIEGTLACDGEEIDAYILGCFKPVDVFKGRVIAIIKRKNDDEDKLVVAETLNSYNREQIIALTEFHERFFESEIVCCSGYVGEPKIRPLVLGLARNENKILVSEGYDAVKDQFFYRFLGGGVEFGERFEEALIREFKEELNVNIEVQNKVCTLENIFTFEKRKGHEIVSIFEIKLPKEIYDQSELKHYENSAIGRNLWIDKDEFVQRNKILYPEEVIEKL